MAVYYNTEGLPVFRNAVITIGTFDGVHMGHHAILQQVVQHAKDRSGESILLTFEPHPRKILFPNQPIKLLTPLKEKIKLLTEAGIKHIVVVPFTLAFADLSAEAYISDFLVKLFHPSDIVIGHDHHFGHDRKGNIYLLKQLETTYNYHISEIPAQLIDEAAISSTKIRNALTEGRVEDAAIMLGRSYSLSGTVIRGAQIGNKIGFPTANLQPANPDQLIPANGVYAVQVKWDSRQYNGMLNIGVRPTVSNDHQLHIEVNIFDFNEDVYDEEIELQFITRLRDEQKFPSVDALKEQLEKDKLAAQKALGL
jgi:riboflavin kinase/FMN adenylyltransferase